MAAAPRQNRVPIMFSDEELEAIDDWRFACRIPTRARAIRKLIQTGMEYEGLDSPRPGLIEAINELRDKAAAEARSKRRKG